MLKLKRNPATFGILCAICIFLIFSQLGCEKGNLGIKGGNVAGSIVDGRTLAGISNVSVEATMSEGTTPIYRQTSTDSNGNFYFSNIPSGEWGFKFDKFGYSYAGADAQSGEDEEGGGAGGAELKSYVENNKTTYLRQIRLTPEIENQYITVRGVLKDAINGNSITYGNAQFIFGDKSFSDRLPTEFQTGFQIPAFHLDKQFIISVNGYKSHSFTVDSGLTDRDFGVILLQPETFNIEGRFHDVPGWVFEDGPTATVFAYVGNRLVATATAKLNDQQFSLKDVPRGSSVSIEIEVKGYRMNGPVVVNPPADFQGTIYQVFSLRNHFSAIMRDVRVIVAGTDFRRGDYVGAYCEETGDQWPQTTITSDISVVDLGTNRLPTGYSYNFTAYNASDGTVVTNSGVRIDDDGANAQVVTISL